VISISFICVVGESYVILLGRVVPKPVNANPGLKVNQDNNFSPIKMLSIAYVLCCLRVLVLKTGEQIIQTEHLAEKLQK